MREVESTVNSMALGQSNFRQIIEKYKTGWRSYIWVLWALLGPGLIATLANNDAGGVISYAITGAIWYWAICSFALHPWHLRFKK